MNLLPLAKNDITELLVIIIRFTQMRQKTLIDNIFNIHTPGFTPRDLMAREFSLLLNRAISEHTQNQRLVLHDTDTIRFGLNGDLHVDPLTDHNAQDLLQKSKAQYLQLQIDKLVENALNQRIAAELLRTKQQAVSMSEA
jgi:flagellar basal body rod protein FlgB